MRTSTSTELRRELADIVTCQDDDGEDEEEEDDPEEEREDEEQEEDREEGKVDKYYLGSVAEPSWPAVAAIRNPSKWTRGGNHMPRLKSKIRSLPLGLST
jgi:hypothetical protein